MTTALYINCGILALLGLAFATLLQMKSQRDKALLANLQFSAANFLKLEWMTISCSVIVIIIGLYLIPTIVGINPKYLPYVKPAFVPLGYMGTDIILKLFGVVNKRLNAAIDAKTTQADKANGTVDAPTPATKP